MMQNGEARTARHTPKASAPSLLSQFTPELLVALRAGYGRGDFSADLVAGITVAVLALPLSLAIAIGCGADPVKGLISSVINPTAKITA